MIKIEKGKYFLCITKLKFQFKNQVLELLMSLKRTPGTSHLDDWIEVDLPHFLRVENVEPVQELPRAITIPI